MMGKTKKVTIKAVMVLDEEGNYGIGGSSDCDMSDPRAFADDWNLNECALGGDWVIGTVTLEVEYEPPRVREFRFQITGTQSGAL